MNVLRYISVATLSILSCCAGAVDDFQTRMSDAESNYHSTAIADAFLNIIRSGFNDSPTFVGAGKFTAVHNFSAGTTLPNVVLGPGKTAAQKQYIFSQNGISTQINSTVEASALNTASFINGFLSEINLSEFTTFISQGHSREMLYYLFFDSVRVTTSDGRQFLFANDPLRDMAEGGCTDVDYSYIYDFNDDPLNSKYPLSPYSPLALNGQSASCPFHKFQWYIEEGMRYGLSVDIPPRDAKKSAPASIVAKASAGNAEVSVPASAATAAAKEDATPRLCYDRALANPIAAAELSRFNHITTASGKSVTPLCGSTPAGQEGKDLSVRFRAGNREITEAIQLTPRSLGSLLHYLGQLARRDIRIKLFDPRADYKQPATLFQVSHQAAGCYVAVNYAGQPYCIPAAEDPSREVVLIVDQLKQINTNRSDIPTNDVTVSVNP